MNTPRFHSPSEALAASLVCVLLVLGCKSKAVAVEQCREIEHARCEASVPCGTIARNAVEECKRIYTDQCLHGIAGPNAPSASEQDACLSLIQDSEEIAQMSEEGDRDYDEACDVIGKPWESEECDFLNPSQGGASGDDKDD